MRTLLFMLYFFPMCAPAQDRIFGKYFYANNKGRSFLIFRSDSTFEYPSAYAQFHENHIGKYHTKDDTVFLHFPVYKVDTVVGYGKGILVGLTVDQNTVSLKDT